MFLRTRQTKNKSGYRLRLEPPKFDRPLEHVSSRQASHVVAPMCARLMFDRVVADHLGQFFDANIFDAIFSSKGSLAKQKHA